MDNAPTTKAPTPAERLDAIIAANRDNYISQLAQVIKDLSTEPAPKEPTQPA